MRELRGENFVAFVDDDIYPLVSQYKWYVYKGHFTDYLATNMKCADGKTRTCYLHRLVMGLQPDENPEIIVHHRDSNGFNDQKSNLAMTTNSGNQLQIGKRKTNTSGFLGVTKDKSSKRKPWKAQVQLNGKTKTIGRFATPQEAARARDKYVFEHHGKDAYFNFSDELPR